MYYETNFYGLVAPDALDYSTVARNIINGNGMRMDSISWVHLLSSPDDPFRVIVKSILYPIVLVPFFFLFGPTENVTAFTSGLFFILIAPCLFILARDLYGRNTAWGTVFVYLASRELLTYSISGLTEPMFILLITVELLILLKARKNIGFFGAGVLLGVARLLRVNAVVLILPIMLYIWLVHENRIRRCLVFTAGLLFVMLPLMIRDAYIFGDPIFGFVHLIATRASGATPIAETAQVHSLTGAIRYILGDIVPFIKRYSSNLLGYYHKLLSMAKFPVIALFLVGLLKWGRNSRGDALRLLIMGAIVIQLLLLSAYTNAIRIRYFQVFNPFLIMFAVAFFFDLWSSFAERKKWLRRLLIVLMGLYIYLPYLQSVSSNNALLEKIELNQSIRQLVTRSADLIKTNGIVVSDIPFHMAWIAERRGIHLPYSHEDYSFIVKKYTDAEYLFLTSTIGGGNIQQDLVPDWVQFIDNPPENFKEKRKIAVLREGDIYAVLYGPK